MPSYRGHYETFVDVVADSEEEAERKIVAEIIRSLHADQDGDESAGVTVWEV